MKLVSTIIDEIKQDFEGGNSLACDWNIIIKRAVQNAVENINPSQVKKEVPIYGGFLRDVYVNYCPANVRIPSTLKTNDGTRAFTYVPSKVFHAERNVNTFTIENINGYKFLMAFHNLSETVETIDEMDSVTTMTGTATPVLNEQNYLNGSASVSGTFTDAGKTLARTLTTALDLSDFSRGAIILPSYFTTASNISSVSIKLLTSVGNYTVISSTVDSIGSTFINGWNRVRFLMKNKVDTGTLNLASIASWEITCTTITGATETVLFDNITIHQSAQYYLEHYSDQFFVNGSTNAWQTTVDYNNGDYLNFTEDECAIVHYEACILLATSDSERNTFASQLKRKYTNYNASNPSDEEPFSYNISEKIDMSVDGSVNNIPSTI